MEQRTQVDFVAREVARRTAFDEVWEDQLDDVFADVADYYDRANVFASLGLWSWLRRSFVRTIELPAGARVLDVCAGTNAIGMALLDREPRLEVHAIDRSEAMQRVGAREARRRGHHIESHIGDVHRLPFPDAHFDIVTLQYASRHLRVMDVFGEIHRVLKPGGRFHHCDMLRPENRLVEELYYAYLRGCLTLTGLIYRSNESALGARRYFIKALRLFYSPTELAQMLRGIGFSRVSYCTRLCGTIGFHRADKALARAATDEDV